MIKITIAGDFSTTYRGEKAIKDGNAFSSEIVELLKDSDIAIVNLESPVANDTFRAIEKIGPNLRTSNIAISYLKKSGCNVVTLANNHFFDYGEDGVRQTIDCLNENHIQYVGGGLTEKELRKVLYVEKGNQIIAILNYCETEFSVQDGIGSNPLNTIRYYYDVKEAKAHADVIITIIHGGHEGYNLPSPRMQETYRYMIDCGADVVINHHQHCYSGYELYNGRPIYYGLGNFFFDDLNSNELWTEGYIVSIQIENKRIAKTKLHPYIQCRGNETFVRLMDESEKEGFNKKIESLNSVISDRKIMEESFVDFCKKRKKNYLIVLAPYSNRLLAALSKRNMLPSFITNQRKLMLQNYIQCEAHRDLLLHSLK